MSNSLQPDGLQHTRLPCLLLPPRVCSNSCLLSQWCRPTTSSSVAPFSSCPQCFPASRSFPMSRLFASGGQSIGVSAFTEVCVHAQSLRSFPILWDPIDCSPPGSSAHGILQARILEWFAISFSRGSSQSMDQTHLSLLHWQAGSLPLTPTGKPYWSRVNLKCHFRNHVSSAGGTGTLPGRGTKIPHATGHCQKKFKKIFKLEFF